MGFLSFSENVSSDLSSFSYLSLSNGVFRMNLSTFAGRVFVFLFVLLGERSPALCYLFDDFSDLCQRVPLQYFRSFLSLSNETHSNEFLPPSRI